MLVLGVVSASPSWSVEVGDPMPGFAIQTFDGARTSHETFKGKPLLLIFWNTWCPNCVRELPEIERLHEAYGPRGLAILGVNTAMNDSEAKARAYWERSDYKFPGAFDRYFETGQAFRIFSVPTILLIDSRGIVRYKQARLPDDVDKRLDELTIRQ
jgi:thiol-disulfide isomerase/thioredoxin